jgi:hypothetical protein
MNLGGLLTATSGAVISGADTSIRSANNASQVNVTNTGTVISQGTNSVTVAGNQTATIGGNTLNYGTQINGGLLVNGDLGVNGSLYSLNTQASTGVSVGNNGLTINGSTNTVRLVADSNTSTTDGRAELNLSENTASLLVDHPVTGKAHGLTIDSERTVLSGGANSTSLTLDDNKATFSSTGEGPARVTGIADGKTSFDAVNYRQLKTAYSGIAAVSALSAIPSPLEGKNYAIGFGYGNFEDQNAIAFGGQARFNESFSVKAGIGHTTDTTAMNVGVGYSW